MAYVTLKKAAAELGLHPHTLRKYADNGTIRSIKNGAGQRYFDVQSYLHGLEKSKTVCYARVSSHKQKDDLCRQVARLRSLYPDAEIIEDIGGGLNFKRKGLQTLLERMLRGDKFDVVVAHRDRLCRFGFDLIEFLVLKNGGKLVVLDRTQVQSSEAELTSDLLAILHHFSCKMHGKRSHQGKADSVVPDSQAEGDLQTMVRSFKESLQRDSRFDSGLTEAESLDGCLEGDFDQSAGLGQDSPVPD